MTALYNMHCARLLEVSGSHVHMWNLARGRISGLIGWVTLRYDLNENWSLPIFLM